MLSMDGVLLFVETQNIPGILMQPGRINPCNSVECELGRRIKL